MRVSALVCAVWLYLGSDFSSISQLPPCCRPPHQSAPFGLFFAFYTIMYLCGGRPVARICTCLRRLVVFGVGFLAVYRNCHPVAALRTNLRRLVFLLFIGGRPVARICTCLRRLALFWACGMYKTHSRGYVCKKCFDVDGISARCIEKFFNNLQ